MSTRSPEANSGSTGKANFSLNFPLLYSFLLALLCAVHVWRPLQGGEDFWSHAAVGRWIFENARVPSETLWIWSTPPQPWVAHSWFSEIVLYFLMQSGGAHLVLFATFIFVALPFLWAWRLWCERDGNLIFGALFFSFALSCAAVRFQPRPELFTYFFLSILLLFLIRNSTATASQSGHKLLDSKAWGIVAMFALWANCHGAVALGLAILLMTASCEVFQQRNLRAGWPLLRLTVLCAAAINLNPYGLRYWTALGQVGGDMFSMIDEWKSPLAEPALPPIAIGFVLVIAIVALLAWLGNDSPDEASALQPRRWSHLVWLLFFTAMFFSARRNLWPAMLVSVIVAAANAQTLRAAILLPSFKLSIPARVVARVATGVLLLAWSASSISPEAASRGRGGWELRAVSGFAPVGVADYVLTKNPPAPIFNDYLRSSYFSWRFAGQRELYIDIQNAYPPQLLRDYFDIIGRTPRGIEQFEKLEINTVIFGPWDKKIGRLAPLAKHLDSSPAWKREYSGEDGAVWVRKQKYSLSNDAAAR